MSGLNIKAENIRWMGCGTND